MEEKSSYSQLCVLIQVHSAALFMAIKTGSGPEACYWGLGGIHVIDNYTAGNEQAMGLFMHGHGKS